MARKPPLGPHVPPPWEIADAGAIQALMRGEAGPDQQKRVLDYIIKALCGTYDLSYRPESDRATAFAEGRRFVGLNLVKMCNVNLSRMRVAHGGNPDEQH